MTSLCLKNFYKTIEKKNGQWKRTDDSKRKTNKYM